MPFRNPYHFVPVERDIRNPIPIPNGEEKLSRETLGHRTFDRYHRETHSGRVVCTLETVTPTVIGGTQESAPEDVTVVQPFKRGGLPAIPASTLRGCLSSLAEAASNSALRVLHDDYYSRRVVMDEVGERIENFSALGLIVRVNDTFRLRPLALPTIKLNGGRFIVPSKYRIMFPNAALKAYCYNRIDLENGRTHESVDPVTQKPKYYHARLAGGPTIDPVTFEITGPGGYVHGPVLLGRNLVDGPFPHNPGPGYTRGLLRVLYEPGRDDILETEKRHEFFIPYPPGAETGPTYPILASALARFERLAADRKTENKRRLGKGGTARELLPYALKGSQAFPERVDKEYGLQDGDIVFFVPDDAGQAVAEVWVSQLWRKEIPGTAKDRPGTTHDFFHQVNPELLPFNRKRRTITPAEALFGFVEVNDRGEEPVNARALASRVRFSEGRFHAAPAQGAFQNEVVLKILASPKPPCPSLYFRRRNPGANPQAGFCYIAKKDLRPQTMIPQGRKFYLHHASPNHITSRPQEDRAQKNKVTPLRPGVRFTFSIDFDNLSPEELGLLLHALTPTPDFHHKIGLGKPLGLGTVKIAPAGLFLVDRQARYSVDRRASDSKIGFVQPRYRSCWVREDLEPIWRDAGLGPSERSAANDRATMTTAEVQALIAGYARTIPPAIRNALNLLGQVGQTGVYYPRLPGQPPEDEGFKWFQANDQGTLQQRQGLVPLEFSAGLPTLQNA